MKAVIHIGTHKTGSTSIQHFLEKNRENLKNQKVFVPKGFLINDRAQHEELFVAALKPDLWHPQSIISHFGCSTISWVFNDRFDVNDQEKLWQNFWQNIKTDCHQDDLVLLSCENLAFLTKHDIEKLKNLLDSVFDDITIVLYLRRQPEYLVSFLGNLIFYGMGQTFWDCVDQPEEHAVWAYHKLIDRWSVFGKNKLKIHVFDKQEFQEKDLFADFASLVGFDIKGLERVKNKNESIDSASLEFLRLINLHYPVFLDRFTLNRDRWPLSHCLGLNCEEKRKSYYLNRNEARQILTQCREGNDWVAREYFGREKLFSDDLSMYPEEVDSPHGLTLEKCAGLTAAFWEERCRYIHHLQQENQNLHYPQHENLNIQHLQHENQRLKTEIQRLLQHRDKRLLYRCKTALTWMKKGIANARKAVTRQEKRQKTRHTHETVEKN